jgi:hypothetical protein
MARNAPFADEWTNGICFDFLLQARDFQLKEIGITKRGGSDVYLIDVFPPHREMWVARSQSDYLEVLWLARIEFEMQNIDTQSLERQQIMCLLANDFYNEDNFCARLTAFPMALLALRHSGDDSPINACSFGAEDLLEPNTSTGDPMERWKNFVNCGESIHGNSAYDDDVIAIAMDMGLMNP